MRYNDNREVNEMQHRDNGERDMVTSSDLQLFLGDDNYQNKAEEMLLDMLNHIYPAEEAIHDIINYVKQESE